jgi:hypothetical protein
MPTKPEPTYPVSLIVRRLGDLHQMLEERLNDEDEDRQQLLEETVGRLRALLEDIQTLPVPIGPY